MPNLLYLWLQYRYGDEMLRKLYEKFRTLAGSKNADGVLAFVSFYDACLFPTPPEVMLLPAVALKPEKAWRLATIATIFSIIGGIAGYFIGLFLMDTIGVKLFDFLHLTKHIPSVKEAYAKWGGFAIMIKSLIPIPFLIVTWLSGSMKYNFALFVIFSLISRGIRFFAVAGLTKKYGPSIEEFIEKKLYLVTSIIAILIIAIVVLIARGH